MYSTHQNYVELLEDETEDQMLARALEESRKFYNEVEVPRLSQMQQEPGPSKQLGNTCRKEEVHSVSPESAEMTPMVMLDPNGFDLTAGRTWIYPTNYPIRDYQFNIVKTALFHNTLVSLPTGLGKTFIAAVVMYNFYKWFPQGKIIFLAPTKPLVHQQIDSCYNVMGIPKDDTAEMTGAMPPPDRQVAWRKRRLFFLTPQVVTNDLSRGICPAKLIKCVVFDEAHKATGNHAYCQVMKALVPFNTEFRVLALSATPGSGMEAVQKVIENLRISRLEMRNEQSPDTAQYTHHRTVDTVVVKLNGYHKEVQERYMAVVEFYMRRLLQNKVVYGNTANLSKFRLLTARENFRKNPPSGMPRTVVGNIESDFAVCLSLYHGLELLTVHGLRSFLRYISGVLDEDRGQTGVKARLSIDDPMQELVKDLTEKLGPLEYKEPQPDDSVLVDPTQKGVERPFVCSHPKMEQLRDVVVQHFQSFEQKQDVTRVMIFCQYRDTVIEVCHVLSRHRPHVKPMTFVGQSSGKQSRGFSQKQQLMVMKKFRSGGYNTLISTCVGEEGLDIGDVDLIVCFDAHNSPIRLVQRMGRTGRKREGRIVMLLTAGKEYQKYRQSVSNQDSMIRNLANGNRLQLVPSSPRMVPSDLEPQCYQMFMTMPKVSSPKPKKRGSRDLRTMLARQNSKKIVVEDETDSSQDDIEVPAFDRLPETEFLHTYNKEELQSAFSHKAKEQNKICLSRHLDRLTDELETFHVGHSALTNDLVALVKLSESKRKRYPQTQTATLASQLNNSHLWPSKKRKKSAAQRGPGSKKKKKSKAATVLLEVPEKKANNQNRLDVLWSNVVDDLTFRKRPSIVLMPPPADIPKKRRKKEGEYDEICVLNTESCEPDEQSEDNIMSFQEDQDEITGDLLENWVHVEMVISDLQMWQSNGGDERSCCIFEPVFQCNQLSELEDLPIPSKVKDIKTMLCDITMDLPDPDHVVNALDTGFLQNFDIENLCLLENKLLLGTHTACKNDRNDPVPFISEQCVDMNWDTKDIVNNSLTKELDAKPNELGMEPNFCFGLSQLFQDDLVYKTPTTLQHASPQSVCVITTPQKLHKEHELKVIDLCESPMKIDVDLTDHKAKLAKDQCEEKNIKSINTEVDTSEFIEQAFVKWLNVEETHHFSPQKVTPLQKVDFPQNMSFKASDPQQHSSPQRPVDQEISPRNMLPLTVKFDDLNSPKREGISNAKFISSPVLSKSKSDPNSSDLAMSPILCSQRSRSRIKKCKPATSTPKVHRKSLFTGQPFLAAVGEHCNEDDLRPILSPRLFRSPPIAHVSPTVKLSQLPSCNAQSLEKGTSSEPVEELINFDLNLDILEFDDKLDKKVSNPQEPETSHELCKRPKRLLNLKVKGSKLKKINNKWKTEVKYEDDIFSSEIEKDIFTKKNNKIVNETHSFINTNHPQSPSNIVSKVHFNLFHKLFPECSQFALSQGETAAHIEPKSNVSLESMSDMSTRKQTSSHEHLCNTSEELKNRNMLHISPNNAQFNGIEHTSVMSSLKKVNTSNQNSVHHQTSSDMFEETNEMHRLSRTLKNISSRNNTTLPRNTSLQQTNCDLSEENILIPRLPKTGRRKVLDDSTGSVPNSSSKFDNSSELEERTSKTGCQSFLNDSVGSESKKSNSLAGSLVNRIRPKGKRNLLQELENTPAVCVDSKKQGHSRCRESFVMLSSDDDDVFVSLPSKLRKKPDAVQNTKPKSSCSSGNIKEDESVRKVRKKSKGTEEVNEFIVQEAEESISQRRDSSDGENTSGLDEYDDSFVDDSDASVERGHNSVDIQAKYLQSVRSPLKGRGQFKMPTHSALDMLPMDVFSQEDFHSDASYEEDSFCVDEEEESQENDAMDTLDIVEAVLERQTRQQQKEKISKKPPPEKDTQSKKKCRKRIKTFSSGSEEERPDLPLTQVPTSDVPVQQNSAPQYSTDRLKDSNVIQQVKSRESVFTSCASSGNREHFSNNLYPIRDSNPIKEIKDRDFAGKSSIGNHILGSNAGHLMNNLCRAGMKEFKEDSAHDQRAQKIMPQPVSEVWEEFPNMSSFPEEINDLKPEPLKNSNVHEVVELQDLCIDSWGEDDFMFPNSQSLLAPKQNIKVPRAIASHSKTTVTVNAKDKVKPLTEYFSRAPKEFCIEPVRTNVNRGAVPISFNVKTRQVKPVPCGLEIDRTRAVVSSKYPAVCTVVRTSEAVRESDSSEISPPVRPQLVRSNSNSTPSPNSVVGNIRPREAKESSSPLLAAGGSKLSPAMTRNSAEHKVEMKEGLVVIVSSRQMSASLDVITALKARHHATVDIRSISVAHFVLSWRVGVIRVTLADFLRTGNWSSLLDTVFELRSLFRLPFVAVENNRNTPLSSAGKETPMWPSHLADLVDRLHTLGIRVFFSENQENTSHLLALLCERENAKGHGIIVPGPQPTIRIVLKFLEALPGVNIALAMKLCQKFTTVVSFIRSCNSVSNIQRVMGVNRESALLIHSLFSAVAI